MKKLLPLICFLLVACAAGAQRMAVDSSITYCYGAASATTNFVDMQLAEPGYFWVTYAKEKRGAPSGHSTWHGTIQVEKRSIATLAITDSLVLEGNGALMETESDKNGNLYILGFMRDSVKFSNNYTSYGKDQHFVAKLDKNMKLQWVNDTLTEGDKMAVAPDGDVIYLRGELGGFGGDVFVHKLDGTGLELQAKEIKGIGYLADIKTNAKHELYFSGGCSEQNVMFDTVDASHSFSYNMHYGKYSADLVCEWFKNMNDFTCLNPWLDIDTAGNVLFYGALNKPNILGGFDMRLKKEEFLFSVTAPDGKVQFAIDAPDTTHNVTIIGNKLRGISVYNNTAAILLKQKGYNDTINWSKDYTTATNIWLGMPLLLEYNTLTGTMSDATILGEYLTPINVLCLPAGDVLVAGCKDYTAVSIIKYHTPPVVGVPAVAGKRMAVYPNPTNGMVYFSQKVSGSVYTITGQKIFTCEHVSMLDMSACPAGAYIFKSTTGEYARLVRR